jgi:hypothetical protein
MSQAPKKIRPLAIICGRGQAMRRKTWALRMDEAMMEHIRATISGPTYLAIQYLCERGLEAVKAEHEKTGQMLIIEAEKLDEAVY